MPGLPWFILSVPGRSRQSELVEDEFYGLAEAGNVSEVSEQNIFYMTCRS